MRWIISSLSSWLALRKMRTISTLCLRTALEVTWLAWLLKEVSTLGFCSDLICPFDFRKTWCPTRQTVHSSVGSCSGVHARPFDHAQRSQAPEHHARWRLQYQNRKYLKRLLTSVVVDWLWRRKEREWTTYWRWSVTCRTTSCSWRRRPR